MRAVAFWLLLVAVIVWAFWDVATSPQLAYRQGVYIVAGFAGVLALAVMPVQASLARGFWPGASLLQNRRWHRWLGVVLALAVVVHVAGLWITSPPDVVDALLWRSPTSFTPWGVAAMWAIFAAALFAAFRRKVRPSFWRLNHTLLVSGAVVGTVVHTLMITGTMGAWSKWALCAVAGLTVLYAVWATFTPRRRSRANTLL